MLSGLGLHTDNSVILASDPLAVSVGSGILLHSLLRERHMPPEAGGHGGSSFGSEWGASVAVVTAVLAARGGGVASADRRPLADAALSSDQ